MDPPRAGHTPARGIASPPQWARLYSRLTGCGRKLMISVEIQDFERNGAALFVVFAALIIVCARQGRATQ